MRVWREFLARPYKVRLRPWEVFLMGFVLALLWWTS